MSRVIWKSCGPGCIEAFRDDKSIGAVEQISPDRWEATNAEGTKQVFFDLGASQQWVETGIRLIEPC